MTLSLSGRLQSTRTRFFPFTPPSRSSCTGTRRSASFLLTSLPSATTATLSWWGNARTSASSSRASPEPERRRAQSWSSNTWRQFPENIRGSNNKFWRLIPSLKVRFVFYLRVTRWRLVDLNSLSKEKRECCSSNLVVETEDSITCTIRTCWHNIGQKSPPCWLRMKYEFGLILYKSFALLKLDPNLSTKYLQSCVRGSLWICIISKLKQRIHNRT